MATLVFKVFALTIRTVSKPLAARLNQTLLSHLSIRDHLVRIANVSAGIPAEGTCTSNLLGSCVQACRCAAALRLHRHPMLTPGHA